MQPYQYLFIVAYGRSGSTVLKNIVSGIPGYHIAGENGNALYRLYQSHQAIKFAKEKFSPDFAGPEGPWAGAGAFEPDRFAQRLAALFTAEIINPPPDARVIGFKEIRYFHSVRQFDFYLRFIAKFLAPARFILNTRDPDEVARSGWWQANDPECVASEIALYNHLLCRHAEQNPQTCFHVHHNDYRNDPSALRPLFDFLGEAFDEARVADHLARKLSH
jgi:hypothetical protein